MAFVNDDLDLVLFLNSRNRIKFNCRDAIRNYIQRRRHLYIRKCNQVNVNETATRQKFKHILGFDKSRNWCDALSKPLKLSRDLIKHSSWSLAPNRYDVPAELYASRKGAGGAHWGKVHTNKSLIKSQSIEKRPRLNIFYFKKGAKWLFPGNARNRRPTLRVMISTLQGCWKDPTEPGATQYFPRHHLLEYNISPPIKTTPPNPHLFYRYSCVPEKLMSLVPRHISMDPAPGRYETRYKFICPCKPKLIIMPGLKLFVDRQKRNRFRGLPYEQIKTRYVHDPEWRHVIGHGHHYLFKLPKRKASLKLKAVVKGSENMRLKMFHDQRYMNLIIHPDRIPISWRQGPVPELPIRIKYNSLSKRVIRKQLRSNKKIAFMSGQERWKDGYKLPMLTFKQQQANKLTLPFERQLNDYPVLRCSLSEIKSKLDFTPKHMLPSYMPELRKRLFKFLPLPGAKVLVTEEDTRPEMLNGKYQCDNFYGREIIAEQFFLDPSQRKHSKDEDHNIAETPMAATEGTAEGAVGAEAGDKKETQEPKVRLSHKEE